MNVYDFQTYWKIKRKYIGYVFMLFIFYLVHKFFCHLRL